jgi:hypothetical protein
MEQRVRHLEMIQAIITRLATNGVYIKGWAVTLISALFALAAPDADMRYVLVAYFPVGMFWALDAYYLRQERLFRALYDEVRRSQSSDFSMRTDGLHSGVGSWAKAAFSKPLVLFYGVIMIVVVIVMIWFL